MIGIDLGYLKSRSQPQHFRDTGGTRPANIVLRDDEDGRGRFPNFFWLLRRGRHLYVSKFCQAQLLEGSATALVLRHGETLVDQREHEQDDESGELHKPLAVGSLVVRD